MPKAELEYIKEEDRVMIIETKYNIGDEVWVKRKGQASEGIIVSITAFADCLYDFKTHKPHSHLSSIIYTIGFPKDAEAVDDWMPTRNYRETDLFPTKEELLKSL